MKPCRRPPPPTTKTPQSRKPRATRRHCRRRTRPSRSPRAKQIPHRQAHQSLIPPPVALIPRPIAQRRRRSARGRHARRLRPVDDAAAGTINVNVIGRIGSAGDNGSVSRPRPASRRARSRPRRHRRRPGGAPGGRWVADGRERGAVIPLRGTGSGTAAIFRSFQWYHRPVLRENRFRAHGRGSGTAGNSDQYHVETEDQYRPSNTNVSIRLSSPGDNGPVTQTTIAISAGASRSRCRRSRSPQ